MYTLLLGIQILTSLIFYIPYNLGIILLWLQFMQLSYAPSNVNVLIFRHVYCANYILGYSSSSAVNVYRGIVLSLQNRFALNNDNLFFVG